MTVSEELDLFVAQLPTVPDSKRYWLIRTQSGHLYETFRENGVVALEHQEISLFELENIRKQYENDETKVRSAIRNIVISQHTKDSEELDISISLRTSSLVASQIFKFIYEVKQGDIVIIPSFGSDFISFGEVMESRIGNFSAEEMRKIDTDAILRKRVKWIKDVARRDIDPYLNRIFSSHQALNDVGAYADIIERSLTDFFILDDEAHLIINVQAEHEINAVDLFGLGYKLLKLVDKFSEEYGLGISSNDLQVSITLNSPGKIDFKSKIKKVTLVSGILLGAFGGGYEDSSGHKFKTDGLPGLIRAVTEFKEASAQRDIREEIFHTYKDSLKVKEPEEMNKLLKQFSDNKDLPK